MFKLMLIFGIQPNLRRLTAPRKLDMNETFFRKFLLCKIQPVNRYSFPCPVFINRQKDWLGRHADNRSPLNFNPIGSNGRTYTNEHWGNFNNSAHLFQWKFKGNGLFLL